MNIEITDLDMILNYLETTSLEPHDNYSSEFTYKDQKILYKYIKQLQQENKQLKERIEYLERSNNRRDDTILEQRQEISDLEDNWNKLKHKLSKIETLIINHNCDTGDIYYKYNSRFLKSELKQRILEIVYEEGSDSNE